jgi:hypothetical protein
MKFLKDIFAVIDPIAHPQATGTGSIGATFSGKIVSGIFKCDCCLFIIR